MKFDRRWIPTLLILTFVIVSTGLAQEDYFIRIRLTGDQVAGMVDTPASGQVTAALVGETLVVVGDYQDLTSPIDRLVAGGAHIHTGAKGENGGIAFRLNIDGGTEGGFTGIFALSDEEIETLKSGGYYVQLHTETNQPGELRGQLAANVTVADLVGLWERPVTTLSSGTLVEPGFLEIKADGSFNFARSLEAIQSSGEVGIVARSRYRLEGSLIIFDDRSFCESPEPGSYQLDVTVADQLRFIPHHDSCSAATAELPRAPFMRLLP